MDFRFFSHTDIAKQGNFKIIPLTFASFSLDTSPAQRAVIPFLLQVWSPAEWSGLVQSLPGQSTRAASLQPHAQTHQDFHLQNEFPDFPQADGHTIPLQYWTAIMKVTHVLHRFCGCSAGRSKFPQWINVMLKSYCFLNKNIHQS